MIVFPAIDLRGGRCVRLLQGRADAETVYSDDPAAMARKFREAGAEWVHVVDLDGAFSGSPENARAVAAIAATGVKVQLGGGLRDEATVERVLDGGVSRVVIGTRAAEDPDFVRRLVDRHGDQVAVGIDARDGRVAVRGWVEVTETSALDLARKMTDIGVATLIYTDIATDGMLTGPNFPALRELLAAVPCRVIASGGVATMGHVETLAAMATEFPNLLGVITGKAVYEGRIDVAEAIRTAAAH
ncbi:MAG: 1-(5-phosphoribosyl)-5-[(5-phosphoribosylamino)methylideneamino]imidazole-4-carboxamide isomerase [Verrucomicrobia bacterium]|nr:MAG: 1-(5-phosphoribosyl)-5-[(5-phosphoribosylamino)methylideneamino]imidazole-4-carboxamide isomerase [Verrucomicrobiota bacterium]